MRNQNNQHYPNSASSCVTLNKHLSNSVLNCKMATYLSHHAVVKIEQNNVYLNGLKNIKYNENE